MCHGIAARAASLSPGSRSNSAFSATCSSILASGAPMQKWMPAPNETLAPSLRNGSKRSASAKRVGSRLAAREHQPDRVAELEAVAALELDIRQRIAREHMQRRVEAQAFLDRGRGLRLVGEQRVLDRCRFRGSP